MIRSEWQKQSLGPARRPSRSGHGERPQKSCWGWGEWGISNLLDASLSPDLGSPSHKLVWSMTTLTMRQVSEGQGRQSHSVPKQRFRDLQDAEATISFLPFRGRLTILPSPRSPPSILVKSQIFLTPHPHCESYICHSRHAACPCSKNMQEQAPAKAAGRFPDFVRRSQQPACAPTATG